MAAIGGTWFVGPGDGYPADPNTLRFVYATQPDGERYIVAKVWADDGDYASTARLVSAAPDLLAALRVGMQWSEDDGYPDDHIMVSEGERAFRQAARAAIAKAEGRE